VILSFVQPLVALPPFPTCTLRHVASGAYPLALKNAHVSPRVLYKVRSTTTCTACAVMKACQLQSCLLHRVLPGQAASSHLLQSESQCSHTGGVARQVLPRCEQAHACTMCTLTDRVAAALAGAWHGASGAIVCVAVRSWHGSPRWQQ
jgi:hypothetical protein